MNSILEAATNSDLGVLITGETGTGKSRLARKIHDHGARSEKKFVAINLATLAENIIESELFGHERGAFSGADSRRVGKLELANGGTVFLDEIGELPLRLQTKLLEVLNSKTISPVGSNREISLDIRVITATNRDLETMVAAGTFREDLLYRVRVFHLRLEPLRSEREKILPLAKTFAAETAAHQGKPQPILSTELGLTLESLPWLGNIRELKSAMEYAVVVASGGVLLPEHLPQHCQSRRAPSVSPSTIYPTDFQEAKCKFEREYLQAVLTRFQGKINHTASKAGISKVTLIEKIRRYGIDVHSIKFGNLAKGGEQ